MTSENFLAIFFCLFGLFCAIKFQYIGRLSIEQRKKWNRILPFPQREEDFGKTAIVLNPIAFLFIGIFFFIAGLVNLLS